MNNEFEKNIPEELKNANFEEYNPDAMIEIDLTKNTERETFEKTPEVSATENSFEADPPKKKKKIWLRLLAGTLAAGLFFGAGFGTSMYFSKYIASRTVDVKPTTVTLYKADENTPPTESRITEIAQECMPSVVAITNRSVSDVITMFGVYSQESTSSGSGIIVGKNDTELLIVTNYHVVSNSKELSVVFSPVEKEIEKLENKNEIGKINIPTAIVKGYDANKDLAVIAVKLENISKDVLSQIKIATIGDSSSLKPGDQVVAIGNSLGYGQSVTSGVISAVDRKLTIQSADGYSTVTNSFIQTDAAINAGNSGGALLDINGNLIGINSAKISLEGVEGMGYAIPITDVEGIIDDLMLRQTRDLVDAGKQGFLGITGANVTEEDHETFDIPIGVYVNSVVEGLAADKAGIKKGHVITKFDGYTVTTITQLQDRLKYYKEGEKVKLTVMVPGEDGYKEKEFTVKLSNKSENTKDE